MTIRAGNLFTDVSSASAGEEAFSEIFARPGLKIERITRCQTPAQPSSGVLPEHSRRGDLVLSFGANFLGMRANGGPPSYQDRLTAAILFGVTPKQVAAHGGAE
jgi:hypothetical protein